MGVVALVGATALALAWSVIKPGVAEWLNRSAATLGAIERAAAWEPADPLIRIRIGLALAESGRPDDLERARQHVQAALDALPAPGFVWLALAQVLERRGERERARRAAAIALQHEPHNVALRWSLATMLLQWGENAAAADHLRYVLAVDPEQRHVAFQLLRHLAGPGQPVDALMPAEPGALTNILHAGLREGDVSLARAAWERRVQLGPPLPDAVHKVYLNLLVENGEGEAAGHAWSVVAPERELRNAGGVWNGGFEGDPLVGWGLGWRTARAWGVQVQVDRGVAARGSQSLRLTFNSFPNLEFRGVSQSVSVRPGGRYRLEAMVRAVDFVTRSGLKLRVIAGEDRVLAETVAVGGTTSGWVPLSTRVEIPGDVSLVTVVLCRERATQPEGNLGGKVWVDEVALVPLREGA